MSNKLKVLEEEQKDDSAAVREERLALWVQEHGATVLYGFGVLLAVLVIALFWLSRGATQQEADYLAADLAFQEFTQSSADQLNPTENTAFRRLKEMIHQHPELGARYNGLIAQTFLRLGDIQQALVYGNKALPALTKENLPFYEDYSKTSLLIADGQYEDAFRRADFLQKKMVEAGSLYGADLTEKGFGNNLIVLNTIRLGMLHQRLNRDVDELQSWETLRQLQASDDATIAPIKMDPATVEAILGAFKTGKVSFSDYIQDRKKNLRQ